MSIDVRTVKFTSWNKEPFKFKLMLKRRIQYQRYITLTFEKNRIYELPNSVIIHLNNIGENQRLVLNYFKFIDINN